MLSARICCCGAVDCSPCAICAIPETDLTLTVGTGGTTYTLPWNQQLGNGAVWNIACQAIASSTVGPYNLGQNCDGTQDKFSLAFSCQNGAPVFGVNVGSNSLYPCPGPFFCYTCDTFHGFDLIDHTCNPFHYHYRSNGYTVANTSNNCPTVTSVMGAIDFYIDAPASCSETATIQVWGCNSMPIAGASVTVEKPPGTTIASGTTDGSGNFSFAAASVGAKVTIAAGRFITQVWTDQNIVAGGTTNYSMFFDQSFNVNVEAGYECTPGCGYPEPDTLHATHPVFGAITYNWNGSQWVATVVYSYPGNIAGGGTCAAKTVTVTCTWYGDTTYTESWTVDGSDCPDDAGAGGTVTATWTAGAVACYVPSAVAFDAAFSITPSAGAQANLYGVGALTLDIME